MRGSVPRFQNLPHQGWGTDRDAGCRMPGCRKRETGNRRPPTTYRLLVDVRVASALVSLSRALGEVGISWQLGGSGLLYALGLVDTVRDLDVVFPVDVKESLAGVLREHTGTEPSCTARQEDGFASGFRGRHLWDGVELDMTAGIVLDYGTVVARLPFVGGTEWQFQDESIPLAPLEHWLLIYRFHNPKRSESLEPLVSDEKWRKFVRAVGLPDGFTGLRAAGSGKQRNR